MGSDAASFHSMRHWQATCHSHHMSRLQPTSPLAFVLTSKSRCFYSRSWHDGQHVIMFRTGFCCFEERKEREEQTLRLSFGPRAGHRWQQNCGHLAKQTVFPFPTAWTRSDCNFRTTRRGKWRGKRREGRRREWERWERRQSREGESGRARGKSFEWTASKFGRLFSRLAAIPSASAGNEPSPLSPHDHQLCIKRAGASRKL